MHACMLLDQIDFLLTAADVLDLLLGTATLLTQL
jgi:hypothetical protein